MSEASQIEEVAPVRKARGSRTEIAKVAAPANATATSDTAAILSMVESIMTDPNVSVERANQALDFALRLRADAARKAYYSAFADMQPDLPVISKRGTLKTNEKDEKGNKTGNQIAQSRYAKWEDIVEGINPHLAAHGFVLSFKIDQPSEARVTVTCTLGHKDGHTEQTAFSLPIENSGSKNNVQGWGSSVSYAKRYTACALLNIVGRDEDDDGKAAGATEQDGPISEEQLNELIALADEVGADKAKFCRYAKVESFAEIHKSHFEAAKARLREKGARKA